MKQLQHLPDRESIFCIVKLNKYRDLQNLHHVLPCPGHCEPPSVLSCGVLCFWLEMFIIHKNCTGAWHMGMFWQGQPTSRRAEQVKVNSPAVRSRQSASSDKQVVLLGEWMGWRGCVERGLSAHCCPPQSLQVSVTTKDCTKLSLRGSLNNPKVRLWMQRPYLLRLLWCFETAEIHLTNAGIHRGTHLSYRNSLLSKCLHVKYSAVIICVNVC